MVTITIPPDLERAMNARAIQTSSTLEQIAIDSLMNAFLGPDSLTIDHDEWVTKLRHVASPTGISLSEESLSREELYD